MKNAFLLKELDQHHDERDQTGNAYEECESIHEGVGYQSSDSGAPRHKSSAILAAQ